MFTTVSLRACVTALVLGSSAFVRANDTADASDDAKLHHDEKAVFSSSFIKLDCGACKDPAHDEDKKPEEDHK